MGSAANDDVVVVDSYSLCVSNSVEQVLVFVSHGEEFFSSLFDCVYRLPPICSRFRPQETEALAHVC